MIKAVVGELAAGKMEAWHLLQSSNLDLMV
jgi:hypothetical protein